MYKSKDLIKYMSERYQRELSVMHEPGPVITISRQYGCPGKAIAKKLVGEIEKLSSKANITKKWKWVSKEILLEAARELEVDPLNIKYVFDYEKRGVIDDILSAHLHKYYKSDRKIRNTIGKVIRNIAMDGHVVIVGRGGVALAHDIPNSLHVNLEEPLEWRTLRVAEKNCLGIEDARDFAVDIDRKRKEFREHFEGRHSDYTVFDISFNCMTLSVDEIVKVIIETAKIRHIV